MRALAKRAAAFVAVGLVLYAGLYAGAEWLVYRTGDTNPIYKIATTPPTTFDWVILGASHAMPLDFADFNAYMERETGTRIINLATTGTGVLYNRFVLEHFLTRHDTRNVLYVLDSFAFYDRQWNEERFADAKLLRRTPFSLAVAGRLIGYCAREGVPWSAAFDYLTGFPKINNPERFEPDRWEGEAKFERTYRFSESRDRQRIEYLYPKAVGLESETFQRYWQDFVAFVDFVQESGRRLVVIKTPIPAHIHDMIPREEAFDRRVAGLLAEKGVPFHDLALVANDKENFFDTDHLNREGLTQFFQQQLKPILARGGRK